MRKGKTAPNGEEARERKRKAAGSETLINYYRQRRKSRDLQGGKAEEIRESGDDDKGKQGKGFFACYLLTSLSPRHKGHTYIGFTVNPRRRIRQHNGEIGSGAWRTKSKRPWEMVICIYGFPTNVSALQFEWAWQHPQESVAVREAAATFKSLSGVANKIKLAYTMLTLPAWQSLNITVNYFSTKYRKDSACCPSLPEQMKVQVCSMNELPCYTEQDEFEYKDDCDNLDEYDEVNDTCETVWETYPDEVVNASADNFLSSIHEASHEEFEDIEEYKTRKPVDSSTLGVHNIQPQVFIDSPTSKTSSIATGLPMVGPQPWVREKLLTTTYEGYEKPGDSSTFGIYHTQPFDCDYSPVRTSPSFVTSLSDGETAEGANTSIIEKECPSRKQFTAVVAANEDRQPGEKPLTTDVAVLEDQLPSSTVAHEVEVIDLLTPSPACRLISDSKKRRISMFSPEIIDLT
ncbi:PREDICTED: uncharacterized protein LOC18591071 [Theobroma cacao]|uniref:Structure-specific endonuclease subunit SLX1 homolog n=1 Tax=Theobroma cacao TaxID=3641 RepID=A0AB32UTJ0_THECC|nr:PREDICTED: uncharacterized protein LOC18591071 [Theobroma cacao]